MLLVFIGGYDEMLASTRIELLASVEVIRINEKIHFGEGEQIKRRGCNALRPITGTTS